MVAERRVIDIETLPGNAELASELAVHEEGIILRRHGQKIGLLSRLTDPAPVTTGNPLESAFGAMRDVIESPDDSSRQRDREERISLDRSRWERIGTMPSPADPAP